jgi:hypothetical protein
MCYDRNMSITLSSQIPCKNINSRVEEFGCWKHEVCYSPFPLSQCDIWMPDATAKIFSSKEKYNTKTSLPYVSYIHFKNCIKSASYLFSKFILYENKYE